METAELRRIVSENAPTQKSIWPNGLGFDWYGIEYHFNGSKNQWSAMRGESIGFGKSPEEAKQQIDKSTDCPWQLKNGDEWELKS